MNINDPRLNFQPSDEDKVSRLAAAEYLALMEIEYLVEQAKSDGARRGTGLTTDIFLKLQENLNVAHIAHTKREAVLAATEVEEEYQEDAARVQNVFVSMKRDQDNGRL